MAIPSGLIEDLRRLFSNARAIYVYGGALDCSTNDVDVVVFTEERSWINAYHELLNKWPNADIEIIDRPRETLFFAYVVKTGILVHGESLDIDVSKALENELRMVGERINTFLSGNNEVTVCKSLKELMYLVAALKCGLEGSSNWYRMSRCLRAFGVDVPLEFKNCLEPPDMETLRTVGKPVLMSLLKLLGFTGSNVDVE